MAHALNAPSTTADCMLLIRSGSLSSPIFKLRDVEPDRLAVSVPSEQPRSDCYNDADQSVVEYTRVPVKNANISPEHAPDCDVGTNCDNRAAGSRAVATGGSPAGAQAAVATDHR
jgi:hypothetical protein